MPSIFANEKRKNLDEVKAAADAATRERLADDFKRAGLEMPVKPRDVSNVPEAEVVEPKAAPSKK